MRETNSSKGALEEPLTRREMDILVRLAQGRTNPEIAQLESLAPSSVKWYVNQILGKLRVTSRGEAVSRAMDLGLLKKEPREALALPPHNLPRQLMSFIGRKREIAELVGLVRANPLVTVTGSGGVGKTRLALQAAEGLLTSFPNGVWLVELAPLSDPDLVPQAVIAALGLGDRSGLPAVQRLAEYLRSRECLLILDNCEHLVERTAELAHKLLQACPRLCILATSRETLGVEGEMTYRCPSLSLPDARGSHPSEIVRQSEAVRLFAERAQSACPGFQLNEANAAQAAQICLRLDGIPLAIELAAARLRLLSLAQIGARLENVFQLLAGGSRTGLPRHRTLRGAIDWSYELLSPPERHLLQRLSVFAGNWNLEAAEAVCSDPSGQPLPSQEILGLLGELVDKSMVETLAEGFGGVLRYRMLETIRQYAREQLPPGTEAVLRDRHLGYFLKFCLEAEPHLVASDLREWRERVDAELDNLRLAMDWSLGGPVEKGLRLVAALWWYWHGRTPLAQESRSWLERLLAAEAAGPAGLRLHPDRRIARARALNVLAHRRYGTNVDYSMEMILAREAEEIFREIGEKYRVEWVTALAMTGERDLREVLELMRTTGNIFYITYVLWYLITETMRTGDLSQCRIYFEESLALNRQIGYKEGEGAVSRYFARLNFMEGNLPGALELLDAEQACLLAAGTKGRAHFGLGLRAQIALAQGDYGQALGYRHAILEGDRENAILPNIVGTVEDLGQAAWASGDEDLALRYFEQARLEVERLGLVDYVPVLTNYVKARIAIGQGSFEWAAAFLKEALIRYGSLSYPESFWLQALCILATARGQFGFAAHIFGALEKHSWLLNILSLRERNEYLQAVQRVRAALSPQEFATTWAEGRVMTTGQAIQYALGSES